MIFHFSTDKSSGWGVKNLGSLFKKLRSDFVVNVLRAFTNGKALNEVKKE